MYVSGTSSIFVHYNWLSHSSFAPGSSSIFCQYFCLTWGSHFRGWETAGKVKGIHEKSFFSKPAQWIDPLGYPLSWSYWLRTLKVRACIFMRNHSTMLMFLSRVWIFFLDWNFNGLMEELLQIWALIRVTFSWLVTSQKIFGSLIFSYQAPGTLIAPLSHGHLFTPGSIRMEKYFLRSGYKQKLVALWILGTIQ